MRISIARTLLPFLLVGATLSSTTASAQSGHVDWQGWSFDYDVSGLYDGVSLGDVSFNGDKILEKASFPVMRVYYDNNVCGPYADRMGGTLQPVSWADNAIVVSREFEMEGDPWYEIGIQDKIGNYYIYQSWYLSADGVLDAHIFSKGLQCNVNHEHLPYWRLDFDIGDAENDQIAKLTETGFETVGTEFNEPASAAVNHGWQVRDAVSGTAYNIMFDTGAGNVPETVLPQTAYPNNMVFGRAFEESEDEGWPYGAQAEVPDNNGQNIDGTDLVLWYKGYMPHTAAEGPDLWHSTGIRIVPSSPQVVYNPGDQTSEVGDPVSLTIATGTTDPHTFSASGLPVGLSIGATSGIISGVPTVVAGNQVNLSATNTVTGESASVSFAWNVTASQSCSIFASADVPKSISSSGTPSIVSTLMVDDVDDITELQVLNLKGVHTYMGDLEFILTSPAGTDVAIMERACSSDNNFDLNLDDTASSFRPCPPVGGGTFRPDNPLSAFEGENGSGQWTLRVNDEADQDGGQLQSWELRMCSFDVPPPNNAPVIDAIADQSNLVGESVSLSVSASDPDGNPISYSSTTLPSDLSIDTVSGEITGTLLTPGVFAVEVTVSDGSLSSSTNFNWTVVSQSGESNVALNATVTQSSNAYGGDAARAIDGNTDGIFYSGNSVTHTQHDQNAWWEADLGALFDISDIVVWNRTDCCQSRLTDFHVLISSTPFDSQILSATQNQLGVTDLRETGLVEENVTLAANRLARYVRVQLSGKNFLNLAEVQINGILFGGGNQPPILATIADRSDFEGAQVTLSVTATDPDNDPLTYSATGLPPGLGINDQTGLISGSIQTGSAGDFSASVTVSDGIESASQLFSWTVIDGSTVASNVALGASTSQSSTAYEGVSARAVDGNTNGRFYGSFSVTHTENDQNAWWEVDLGGLYNVNDVVIWNRSDCCSSRLDDFHVLVSSLPFDSQELALTQGQAGVNDYHVAAAAELQNTVAVGRLARYIRVQLSGKNFLNLAEVEVIATTFSGGNQAPILASIADRADFEFAEVNLAVSAIDPDGDVLQYSAEGLPPSLAIDEATGLISGTLDLGSAGQYSVSVSATDQTDTALQTFDWEVIDGSTVPTNVALSATVSQSSVSYGGIPERAIDDDRNGIYFSGNSVTHTGPDENAWWEADLGAMFDISEIVVWGRSDCCISRLTDFHVLTSVDPFVSQDLTETLAQLGVADIHVTGTADRENRFAPNALGRYVRVQLSGQNFLNLAEVEVIATTTTMARMAKGQLSFIEVEIPENIEILSVYPNPFQSGATIRYALPEAERVEISIYDVTGRRVVQLVDGDQAAGYKQVAWDGKDRSGSTVASGLYFAVLEADGVRKTKTLVRVK